jgi:rhamnosyltransferase
MSDVINSAKLPVELVFAVVVSYRCDMARLMSQIERLLEQVSNVVWVDNDSDINLAPYIKLFPASRLHCIILEKNHGIAYAQNKGIELALESKATHVLLMDHDSLPGQKMVDKLLLALHERPDAAAVGPCYMDPRRTKQKTPFFNVRNGWRLQWLDCTDPDVVWPVDHVIASGCLIPAPVLRRVGLIGWILSGASAQSAKGIWFTAFAPRNSSINLGIK